MWNCYLEIFSVTHFFLCDLSCTVLFMELMLRPSVTTTLILYRQMAQWWRVRKFFWPPQHLRESSRKLVPAGCSADTEPPLLWAHWLAMRAIQFCFCVIAEWNGWAQQLCLLFQKDMGAKLFIPVWWGTGQWLRLVMVCALQTCCLTQINRVFSCRGDWMLMG